jgi:predicted amidophosphoribosyltransferase
MLLASAPRCPQCGEQVHPSAGCCAICGADLDPRGVDAVRDRVTLYRAQVRALAARLGILSRAASTVVRHH